MAQGLGDTANLGSLSNSMSDHEHARVSPNLAVRLEAAGVGTARAWLAMQSAYDLAVERASGSPTVRRLVEVA
jgi:plasmid maintenance system antidote protein VapI